MGVRGRYIKARPEVIWKRNTQWPDIPQDPGTDDKLYVVYAVIEDNPNRFSIQANDGSTVDWGDGNSDTLSGGTYPTQPHTYDYSTVSGTVLQLEDGRNYKPVLVEVTVSQQIASPGYLCYIDNDNYNAHNALEVVSYLGDGSSTSGQDSSRVLISAYAIAYLCEHVYLKSPNQATCLRMFRFMNKLKKLELPSNFFNSTVANWNDAFNGVSFHEQTLPGGTISNATSDAVFKYSDSFTIGDIDFGNTTNLLTVFQHANNYKVGNVTALSNTIGLYFYGGTVNNGPRSIGEINMPLLEDCRYMFRNSRSLPEVIFTGSLANVNDTLGMFLETGAIQRCVLPDLTLGFDIDGNQLTADAIDEMFTSLGTASGTQTIDVSGNPGAATCNTSIATGKGFTVIT